MRGALDSALMHVTNSKPGDVLVIRYAEGLPPGSPSKFRQDLVDAYVELRKRTPDALPKHSLPIVLCPEGIEWELSEAPLCRAVAEFAVALAKNGAVGRALLGVERKQFELLRAELGTKAFPSTGDKLVLDGPVHSIQVQAYDP